MQHPEVTDDKKLKFGVFAIYLILLIVSWQNQQGEDIAVTRESFLHGNKNDFLGATGAVFYGLIPDQPIHWWHILLLVQLSFTFLGLILTLTNALTLTSQKQKIAFFSFSYFVLVFSSAASRDGTIISFLILGLGLLAKSQFESSRIKSIVLQYFGFIILIIGFALRPWLGLVIAPIYFWILVKRNSIKKFNKLLILLATIFLVLGPLLTDQAIKKIYHLNSNYPQQIVMIHDLTATYCWSANENTALLAEKGLRLIATNKNSLIEICQFFRPNTWQGVQGITENNPTTKGLSVPIKAIGLNDSVTYKDFQKIWISTILADPFTYFQNHLMFATQVLFSGDSRNLRIIHSINDFLITQNLNGIYNILAGGFLLPMDIFTSLHLFSPIITILAIYNFHKRKKVSYSQKSYVFPLFYATMILWILMTIIGFASDNGRYTLGGTVMVYMAMFLHNSGRNSFDFRTTAEK